MGEAGHIRLAVPADAAVLSRIYSDTVRALGPQLYTPAQVAAWSGFGSQLAKFEEVTARAQTFVWDEGGEVLGFCTLQPDGFLHLLYVAPEATRKGIGGQLLTHALGHGEHVHGVRRFVTKASHFSRALFERHGFVVEEEEHVEFGGVEFHRFAMVREVGPGKGMEP